MQDFAVNDLLNGDRLSARRHVFSRRAAPRAVGFRILRPLRFQRKGAEELSDADRDHFVVVFRLEVIGHLPDPVSFLEDIADMYRNLCHVIVTAPACPELWTNYDEFNGHCRRYTPDMIQGIAGRMARALVRHSYIFRLVYPPLWFLSRSGGRRPARVPAPDALMVPVHTALARLLLLEHRDPPGILPGSSIIATFSLGRSGDHGEDDPSLAPAWKSG